MNYPNIICILSVSNDAKRSAKRSSGARVILRQACRKKGARRTGAKLRLAFCSGHLMQC